MSRRLGWETVSLGWGHIKRGTHHPSIRILGRDVVLVRQQPSLARFLPGDAQVHPVDALHVALIALEVGILDLLGRLGHHVVYPGGPWVVGALARQARGASCLAGPAVEEISQAHVVAAEHVGIGVAGSRGMGCFQPLGHGHIGGWGVWRYRGRRWRHRVWEVGEHVYKVGGEGCQGSLVQQGGVGRDGGVPGEEVEAPKVVLGRCLKGTERVVVVHVADQHGDNLCEEGRVALVFRNVHVGHVGGIGRERVRGVEEGHVVGSNVVVLVIDLGVVVMVVGIVGRGLVAFQIVVVVVVILLLLLFVLLFVAV